MKVRIRESGEREREREDENIAGEREKTSVD